MSRITLLTDFGTRDGYVGAMKGVVASIFPGVSVDDVSHEIRRGDIEGAAFALRRYWKLYPPGTVHCIVVDPGVGTRRRALAVEADRRFLVAPDNGVLSRVFDEAGQLSTFEISNADYIRPEPGHTFHGRDVFAPAAAYLARGVHLSRLGGRVSDPVRIGEPEVEVEGDSIVGRVISLDRFGNLLTNVPGGRVSGAEAVEVEGRSIPMARTYGEVGPRELAAVVNSDGRLEVAARDTSAAELLKVGVGTRVLVKLAKGSAAGQADLAPA